MIDDPVFYALAIPAVILMGLAKGEFSGVGAVSMPLLAMAVSPVQAAAILLPILIVQDTVSVWAFRRDWDRRILTIMIPGAAVGILAGYLLAAQVSAAAVLGAVWVEPACGVSPWAVGPVAPGAVVDVAPVSAVGVPPAPPPPQPTRVAAAAAGAEERNRRLLIFNNSFNNS